MMLDLAATLDGPLTSAQGVPYALQLIFFDGEEAFGEWSATDSIYGSRHLASAWGAESLAKVELFVLLDLIGAPKPRLLDWFPQATGVQFRDMAFMLRHLKSAQLLHDNDVQTSIFGTNPGYGSIEDDHLPWLRAGVPVLHLIAVPFPPAWHTVGDSLASLDRNVIEDLTALLRCYVASILHVKKVDAPGSEAHAEL